MLRWTCLPSSIRSALESLRSCFGWEHFLYFSWLIALHLLSNGPCNLQELWRMAPLRLPYHKLCRFLSAQYWYSPQFMTWFACQLFAVLPAPLDRICFIIADSSYKPKRGKKNTYLKKGKQRKNEPWLFGFHFLLISLQWHYFRIPIAFVLIRPKDDPLYRNENYLFRQLLQEVVLPDWVEQVMVLADAAYASKENLRYISQQGWFYLMSLAKTWKLSEQTHIKDFIASVPRYQFKRTWIPALTGRRRRVFFACQKRLCLNSLGDVTVVFSRFRRNDGLKATRILVTNLPENLSTRTLLQLYQRRWHTEILFKELKSGLGLGQYQVSGDEQRTEESLAIPIMAYLLLLRLQFHRISATGSWSIFEMKRNFLWESIAERYSTKPIRQKPYQERKTA